MAVDFYSRLELKTFNGDSRSCMRGSGGVVTLRAIALAFTVDEGTTLPDMERPFAPNGTGGFRIPIGENVRF